MNLIKKITLTGAVLAGMLLFSGCNGKTNTNDTAITDSGTAVNSGTGTYVDSNVSGVSFQCGSFSGKTDENGTFIFEEGYGCTFSLAHLALRTVESDGLYDEVIIFEDRLPVAQLLQTLDNDGNASNGITISEEVLAYLKNNASDFPNDFNATDILALFNEMNGSVPGYEGDYVTPDEAAAHLEETRQAIDHTAPVITLNGDAEMIIAQDDNGTFTDPGYNVSDDYYPESEINVTISGDVNVSTVGDYAITYTARDGAGNEASVTRTVHVTDQAAPVISLTNTTFTIEAGSSFTTGDALNGVSATDIVDGAVTVVANISAVQSGVPGDYTVTYTATDAAGNQASTTATVHVVDTTAPMITLTNTEFTIEAGSGFTTGDALNGVSATDVVDGNVAVVANISAVQSGVPGDYTVTYTATDAAGNQASATATVHVVDTTAPVITLTNTTFTIEAGSSFTTTDALNGVSATDIVDGAVTVVANISAVQSGVPGDYTVTYSATDAAGNQASATATVHVVDTTAPVITLTNTTFTIEAGSSFTTTDALNGVSATDVVDGNVTVVADISAVQSGIPGDYTVTYTATDAAGNQGHATATVHVVDTTAPVITLNGNDPDTVEADQNASYEDPGVTVTDNSDENITAVVSGSVDLAHIGSYTLTYTATDSSGNESNITRTVEVQDTTPPKITLNGDNPMTVFVNDTYTEPGATVIDNSGEVIDANISGTVDTSTTGTYTITYTATDSSGNSNSVTRTVNVTNGNPPVLTLLGDNPYYVEINTPFVDPGVEATDVEDGDLSAEVTNDANSSVDMNTTGNYTVTYSVTDSQGNQVTATRTVIVQDTTAPVITLIGDNPMNIAQNAAFSDPGATVTDNSGEALDVNVSGTVDTSVVGSYTLTYTATDSAGNSATPVTRTVNVLDMTPPVITTGGDVTIEVGNAFVDPGATAVDAVDGTVNVDVNDSAVDTSVLGDYTVTYTATDSADNQATAVITVHVVDTTAPEIIPAGDNPMNLLVGEDYVEPGATVTDNYDSNLSATVISNDVNTSEVGLYSVVYYAVDSSGNEANATRVVNVTLGQPPVITLNGANPYDVQINTGYTDPGATAEDPEDGTVAVDVNTSEVDMSTLGTYTVYYSATDSQGNTAYAQRTVNVVENVTLTAYPDEVNATDVAQQITVHVTNNDYVPSGVTIDAVQLKVWDSQQGGYVFSDTLSDGVSGTVRVVGEDIEFTPASTFGGGTVTVEYRITGSNGEFSDSWVTVNYPEVIKANSDGNASTLIEPVTVDVLANDTYNDIQQVNITFVTYDQYGQPVYVSALSQPEGNWTVSNQQVLFTPSDTYGGGSVSAEYRIEENGRVSSSYVSIDYPVLVRAYYDWLDMTGAGSVVSVNYDVTGNDVIGNGVTAQVYLIDYSQQVPQQLTQLTDQQGTWTVESNNSITFDPAPDFSGSNAHIEYALVDADSGRYSTTGFDIRYPVYLQANYDRIEGLTDLIEVNVDVMANDTLPDDNSSVVVTIQSDWDYQTGQPIYGTTYTDNWGTWQVEANRTVTFIPAQTFGGGSVWHQYRLDDGNGHISESSIEIVYPVFVRAYYDETNASSVSDSVTYNVLGNDEIISGATPEILFVDYSNGQSYVSTLQDNGGTWSVDGDNNVVFTPNQDFSGGDVHVEYVLSDGTHYSQTGFTIHYPIAPTPVCTVTTLSTVDDVYNAITGNLSFAVENGEREFSPELDKDQYRVDSTLFNTATALDANSMLNPMYSTSYHERTWTTYSNDTFIEAEMYNTIVAFDDINNSWYYDDQKSGNDRGYKYLGSEGEGGSYSVESDGSYLLQVGGADVFSFKPVRVITQSEINNVLETAGIQLTLDASDTAQLNLGKELTSNYDWWGPFDQNSYTSLDAFIQAFTYDSNASDVYGQELVHNEATWQKGILFDAGSSGNTSGTLVEVVRSDNTLLVADAGSWEIKDVTDESGNTYTILDVQPTLCGYEKKIFRLDGTTITQGQVNQLAGEVGADIWFSESLKNKLQQYFIDNAPLDIDPANPVNPEITETMLQGKIFYTAYDRPDGDKEYEKLTMDMANWSVEIREILTDGNGNILKDVTSNVGFDLDEGRIRLDGDGDMKIGLNSNPGTGDWDVTIYTWYGIYPKIWMLNQPSDFPN